MPIRITCAVAFLLAWTACVVEADTPRSDAAIKPTEVLKLFDGKISDDFYTFLKDTQYDDPRNVFRVTDGMLHITGDGLGGLVSKKPYRDYHCVLEYKWGTKTWHGRKAKTKDSGFLIHSNGPDGGYGGIWMPSLEVQIIEGGVGACL